MKIKRKKKRQYHMHMHKIVLNVRVPFIVFVDAVSADIVPDLSSTFIPYPALPCPASVPALSLPCPAVPALATSFTISFIADVVCTLESLQRMDESPVGH